MYVSPITDALINILSDVWSFMACNFQLYYSVIGYNAVVTFMSVSIYTEHALRLCRMKKCCKLYDPPWKNIIITGTSGVLSFRMQILSAHTASVILVRVQIVYSDASRGRAPPHRARNAPFPHRRRVAWSSVNGRLFQYAFTFTKITVESDVPN